MTMIDESLARLLEEFFDSEMLDVHTALPGIVESYDASGKTADIEIQLKRPLEKEDGTFVSEEFPILKNVPVSVAGSGDYVQGFFLSAGDEGMIIFSEYSLDQWRSKGVLTSPSDVGRHTLTGAVFYPGGVRSNGKLDDLTLASGAVFGKMDGAQVRANGDNIEVTSDGNATSDGGYVALADKVDDFITRLDTVMKTWVPVANDGGLALSTLYKSTFGHAPSVPALNPEPTGSSNLKADE